MWFMAIYDIYFTDLREYAAADRPAPTLLRAAETLHRHEHIV